MRIIDEDGRELSEAEADREAGWLMPDEVVVAHHDAEPGREEVGHLEYARFFFEGGEVYEVSGPDDPNAGGWSGEGEPYGAEQRWVVDEEGSEPSEAWDETERVLRYRRFTEAQLAERASAKRRENETASVAAYARMMAPSLPDESAVECKWLFPDWSGGGVAYAEGDRRMHGGTLWKCVSAHTSQPSWEPGAAPSLWAEVLPGQSGEVGPWERPGATNPYMAGDRVTHNGKTWESLIDNNTWEPGAQGSESLWREVGEVE